MGESPGFSRWPTGITSSSKKRQEGQERKQRRGNRSNDFLCVLAPGGQAPREQDKQVASRSQKRQGRIAMKHAYYHM